MLREYRLTNFKAFGETVTIPIRPLTLIFGANSSGKSSIFQSLLLLKQTLEETKKPATVLLPKGSLVDLGTYRDFVHRHETDRNFEFEARFDLEETDALPPLARKIIESVSVTKAGLTVQFSSDKNRPLRRIDLATGDHRQAIISYHPARLYMQSHRRLTERIATLEDERNDLIERLVALPKENELLEEIREVSKQQLYNQKLLEEAKRQWEERGWEEVEVKPELQFWHDWWICTKRYIREKLDDKDEVYLYGSEEKEDFFKQLENYQFEDAVRDLRNALRGSTADYRNFLPEGHDISSVGWPFQVPYFYSEYPEDEYIDGLDISPFTRHVCATFRRLLEYLVYLGPLRSQPERHYEFSGDTTDDVGQSGEYLPSLLFEDRELVEQINIDLERLGVKYQVKLDKLQHEDKSPSNLFSLLLIDTRTKIDASLRDVGFGISQVLPIVVQSRLSEKKTLLIEQPEIHLHPAHQAELGDMFIRSAKERGNTFLLETHSEHLLLRIMRRMRETSMGKLSEGAIAVRPEDVMVLFVESDGSQSIVREMPLNESGELVKAWPGGFFEEGLREIF